MNAPIHCATSFAAWFQSYMERHGLTASKVGAASGFHHNVVQNWRRGRCLPNGFSMVVVATALSELTGQTRPAILESIAVAMLWEV